MPSNNWEKINELFHRALELSKAEREEFLRDNCDDNSMRDELKEMLAAHESDADFLEASAFNAGLEFIAAPQNFSGERVGAYQIIGELGRGGMGVVYQAVRADGAFERRVAIKLLPRSIVSEQLAARFGRERQILANLNHPFIARLFDGGETVDGTPYFVMELVRGDSIVEFCRKRNLSIDERLKLFLKVSEAVDYAHAQGIVHRDLKPSNILIADDGTPKLLDFGIAKFLSNDSIGDTATGFSFLTPEYTSPEQVSGRKITEQTDVYSLGVILYELLTDARPYKFENRSPAGIVSGICESEPKRPSTIGGNRTTRPADRPPKTDGQTENGISKDLDSIVLKSLRKDTVRRYASVAEFSADIENYLQNLPVKARPNSVFYRTGKSIKRNRTATLLTALLTVFAGISVFSLLPKQTAKVYAASVFETDEAVKLTNLPATEEFLQFSADGKNVIFVSNHQLYSVGVDGKNLNGVKTDQSTLRIVESPDGKRYAFAMKDGIYISDKNFAAPEKISECSAGRFSWSPDAKRIVFGCGKNSKTNIFIADISAKNERQLTDSHFCSDPVFAPDGKRIAFTCETGEDRNPGLEIYAINEDGTNKIRLTDDTAGDRLPVWSPDGKHLIFTSDRSGSDEIYMMNADDGADVWRVTFSRGSSDEAAWSRDGKFIAFRSDRDGSESVYAINIEPKILAEKSFDEYEAAFSPDGNSIAFASNRHGQGQIFRREADGKNLRQITWGNSANNFPRYSPDGAKIAFGSNRDGLDELYLMNADGTNQIRLTERDAPSLHPAWSFDGRQIAFVKIVEENKEIFTLDLFSGKETRLTFDKKNDDFPSFTPDGKIVFFSDRTGINEVYQMNVDGSQLVNLSNNPANDGQLSVSKDGKIVFNSNRTRTTELWLMNADGTNQTQMTFTAPDGYNSLPQFSADGKKIIYSSKENDSDRLRVIDVPPGNLAE